VYLQNLVNCWITFKNSIDFFGAVVDKVRILPTLQNFNLLCGRAVIEPKLAFFQEQEEIFLVCHYICAVHVWLGSKNFKCH
jgi:hypothetical protein